jgi:hypothetical protein
MFLPQVRNIIDINKKININYVGRFENLEEDFQIILKNIESGQAIQYQVD